MFQGIQDIAPDKRADALICWRGCATFFDKKMDCLLWTPMPFHLDRRNPPKLGRTNPNKQYDMQEFLDLHQSLCLERLCKASREPTGKRPCTGFNEHQMLWCFVPYLIVWDGWSFVSCFHRLFCESILFKICQKVEQNWNPFQVAGFGTECATAKSLLGGASNMNKDKEAIAKEHFLSIQMYLILSLLLRL